MEVGRPLAISRKAPECSQDAIDRGVLAVSLHEGKLPGDVVNEGDPEWAESPGERDQGQHLSDDLHDIDGGLPGGEGGEVLGLNDPVVVEDVAVQDQNVAPAVLPTSRLWDSVLAPRAPGCVPGPAAGPTSWPRTGGSPGTACGALRVERSARPCAASSPGPLGPGPTCRSPWPRPVQAPDQPAPWKGPGLSLVS